MTCGSVPRRLIAGIIWICGVTTLVVRGLQWSIVEVSGPSMLPALRPGDRLLTIPAVRRLLRSGTLVIIEDPRQDGHLVIKRLIRVAGERAVVIGDAPTESTDSRHWGPIPLGKIHRIVVCRWPHVRSMLVGTAVDRRLADHAWAALRTRR